MIYQGSKRNIRNDFLIKCSTRSNEEIAKLKEEIAKLKEEVEYWKNEYYYLKANPR